MGAKRGRLGAVAFTILLILISLPATATPPPYDGGSATPDSVGTLFYGPAVANPATGDLAAAAATISLPLENEGYADASLYRAINLTDGGLVKVSADISNIVAQAVVSAPADRYNDAQVEIFLRLDAITCNAPTECTNAPCWYGLCRSERVIRCVHTACGNDGSARLSAYAILPLGHPVQVVATAGVLARARSRSQTNASATVRATVTDIDVSRPVTISQGVAGATVLHEGDCMPGDAFRMCTSRADSRAIALYSPPLSYPEGSRVGPGGPTPTITTASDRDGFFQMETPPNEYSALVADNGFYVCNLFDANFHACPMTVSAGAVSYRLLIVDKSAS